MKSWGNVNNAELWTTPSKTKIYTFPPLLGTLYLLFPSLCTHHHFLLQTTSFLLVLVAHGNIVDLSDEKWFGSADDVSQEIPIYLLTPWGETYTRVLPVRFCCRLEGFLEIIYLSSRSRHTLRRPSERAQSLHQPILHLFFHSVINKSLKNTPCLAAFQVRYLVSNLQSLPRPSVLPLSSCPPSCSHNPLCTRFRPYAVWHWMEPSCRLQYLVVDLKGQWQHVSHSCSFSFFLHCTTTISLYA